MQLDPPIGGGTRERTTCQRVGFSKERGSQIPDRRGKVHVVQHISRIHAEGQAVTAVARAKVKAASGSTTKSTAPPTAMRTAAATHVPARTSSGSS